MHGNSRNACNSCNKQKNATIKQTIYIYMGREALCKCIQDFMFQMELHDPDADARTHVGEHPCSFDISANALLVLCIVCVLHNLLKPLDILGSQSTCNISCCDAFNTFNMAMMMLVWVISKMTNDLIEHLSQTAAGRPRLSSLYTPPPPRFHRIKFLIFEFWFQITWIKHS